MNDWYNDPPDDQEPPEWYMALDDVLDSQRGDMPEEVEAAVRAAMHKWEEEYNAACSRPEPEQKDEEMPDPALFCQHCGNPNNNGCGLCNACGENAPTAIRWVRAITVTIWPTWPTTRRVNPVEGSQSNKHENNRRESNG
jgi:hypothetical protein